jgi:hypothetical protein
MMTPDQYVVFIVEDDPSMRRSLDRIADKRATLNPDPDEGPPRQRGESLFPKPA